MYRLLVVGVRWPPETFIARRLRHLSRAGVEVVAAATAPGWPRVDTSDGVHLLRLPHWEDPPTLQIAKVALAVRQARPTDWRRVVSAARVGWRSAAGLRERLSRALRSAALGSWHPDVVHFEWNSAAIDCLPLFDTWNAPVVISCRGSQINVRSHLPGQERFVQGLQATLGRAAAVHCVSQAILQEARQFGLDPAKARVITPAVDPAFFHPADPAATDRDGSAFRLVTTGSLIWGKGIEYALLAVRGLVDAGQPVRFDVIGDGPERQRVLYTVHDLDLSERVRLLGKLPPEQVRNALQRADAFVLSSLSEGISNAVLEAMSCGLPVVTTDCGGMREAVRDGVEGFVVPVRDPKAMSAALLKLAADPALRARMGQAARERILAEFTLDAQCRQFLDLYDSVLRGRRP